MRLHTHYEIVSGLRTKTIKPLFDMDNAAFSALNDLDNILEPTAPQHAPFLPTNLGNLNLTVNYIRKNFCNTANAKPHDHWRSESGDVSYRALKFTDSSFLIVGDVNYRKDGLYILPWAFSYCDKDPELFQREMRKVHDAFDVAKPLLSQKHIYRRCEQGKSAYPFFSRHVISAKASQTLKSLATKIAIWVRDTLNHGQDVGLIIKGRSVSMNGDVGPIEAYFQTSSIGRLSGDPRIRAVERRIESLFEGPDPVIRFSEQLSHNGTKPTGIANVLVMPGDGIQIGRRLATSHEHIEMMGEMNAIFGDLVPA